MIVLHKHIIKLNAFMTIDSFLSKISSYRGQSLKNLILVGANPKKLQ